MNWERGKTKAEALADFPALLSTASSGKMQVRVNQMH